MKRNYRTEIEAALAGNAPPITPLTFYDALFPKGFNPSKLQAKGLSICARRDVVRKVTPNVKMKTVTEPDGAIRTHYETLIGNLTFLCRPAVLGMPMVEHPIKKRDDYRIAKFIVEDAVYEPVYERFLAEDRKVGDSGKAIGHTCYEPMLDIQIVWVGQEQFCYELADNRDAVMDLHESLVQNHLKMYDVVARGPAEWVLYGGNVVPEMLGVDIIRDCVCPAWNRFAERLHEKGKKIGVHLDANNRLILDIVRNSGLDFVEAFTPPPDCNVSVAEARAAWPGKILWINFPSSVHLATDEVIRKVTQDILKQAGDRRGFLMGITEDIPPEHIERSLSVILDTLRG
jgi:hypothetical protein